MSILLTGGLGYIGSHTAVELLLQNEEVIIVDNLENSSLSIAGKIKQITNKEFKFIEADVRNLQELDHIFANNKIDCIVHFAGYKAMEESKRLPLKYYDNNLITTINLLKCIDKYKIKNLVFSSSATVYGASETMPLKEDFPMNPNSTYARTKLFNEEMLKDYQKANPWLQVAILRYFNPIGAHKSLLIGENPKGIPNNLMPYITKVATGKLNKFSIMGGDFPTPDGTSVRDFIHVSDLAMSHISAIKKLKKNKPGLFICNVGTGQGYSVLEIVKTFNKVNGDLIHFDYIDKRPDDIPICYADVTKMHNELNFTTTYSLEEMCKTSYEYEKNSTN